VLAVAKLADGPAEAVPCVNMGPDAWYDLERQKVQGVQGDQRMPAGLAQLCVPAAGNVPGWQAPWYCLLHATSCACNQRTPHAQLSSCLVLLQESVVICGFGAKGQVVANMLESPVASSSSGNVGYIAFEMDVARVRGSRAAGFNVVYGDGTSPSVVMAAGGCCMAACHCGFM
jgi:hypothetical protein